MARLAKLAVVVVVLAALFVTLASLWQQPTYEASARVRTSEDRGAPATIDTRPVAERSSAVWAAKAGEPLKPE
jgi:hypothetical protein